jgi:aryl-alcohol dehydrogenase-like predicted oxidoreductase
MVYSKAPGSGDRWPCKEVIVKYRILGKTGMTVSAVSLGTWQVGGGWGHDFDEVKASQIINKAIDLGVNFLDTADVYDGGLSERACGKVIRSRTEKVALATKLGRRLYPHSSDGYNRRNMTWFVDQSLQNTGLDSIDLMQLHCPPSEVYGRPEVFAVLDDLKAQGKIRHYGVSVERIDEALKAIEYPGVETVMIIFNMFRLRPAEEFFAKAEKNHIGIIVRVPLASGLLTGKFNRDTRFNPDDHRSYNRDGEAFDKGETFSGVDYETGLEAVEQLKDLFPSDYTLAQYALRWILMFDAVSCIVPGASRAQQVESNAAAADMAPLTDIQMEKVKEIYDRYIRPSVHHLW